MATVNTQYPSNNSGRVGSGQRYPPEGSAAAPGKRFPSDASAGGDACSASTKSYLPNSASSVNKGPSHSVGFRTNASKDEYQEERKKYLTAKYPQHQMRLIRKRLQAEDWLDNQLRILYDVVS